VTGLPSNANISYDARGLPIFDDVSKFTTVIDTNVSYSGQMKQATRDLKEAIIAGKVDSSRVTQEQLEDIMSDKKSITGFVWHHNAQSSPNNMQLVPKAVHDPVSHIGQGALSGGKK
jgi:filamentous hemagglutinin